MMLFILKFFFDLILLKKPTVRGLTHSFTTYMNEKLPHKGWGGRGVVHKKKGDGVTPLRLFC